MEIDPNDPLSEEALILLAGFLRLKPDIKIETAYEVILDYLTECEEDPMFHSMDMFTQMVDLIKEASPKSNEVIH